MHAGYDFFEELEALEAPSSASSGRRPTLPFIVKGYNTTSSDINAHYILGQRADVTDDDAIYKIFLDPNVSAANGTDKDRRRPPISWFEFPEMRDAFANGDIDRQRELDKKAQAKSFTYVDGIIIAEQLVAREDGYTARWIKPGRISLTDKRHFVMSSWASVQPLKGRNRVDLLLSDNVVLLRNFGDLCAAVLAHYESSADLDGRAFYLRALFAADASTTGPFIKSRLCSVNEKGGRFAKTDRPLGDDKWAPTSPAEALAAFKRLPYAQKLAERPDWSFSIELLPLISGTTSSTKPTSSDPKAAEKGAALVRQFVLPTVEGDNDQTPQHGWAVSTTRGTRYESDGKQYFSPVLCIPQSGELFDVNDIPTKFFAPSVEPRFAPRHNAKPVRDPNKPLEANFPV